MTKQIDTPIQYTNAEKAIKIIAHFLSRCERIARQRGKLIKDIEIGEIRMKELLDNHKHVKHYNMLMKLKDSHFNAANKQYTNLMISFLSLGNLKYRDWRYYIIT